jgi:hypothetical protein
MDIARLYYHLITDIGSALMLALSTGAGTAILAASITHTFEGALMGAVVGVLLGVLGFGYAVWRTYKPRLKSGRLAA